MIAASQALGLEDEMISMWMTGMFSMNRSVVSVSYCKKLCSDVEDEKRGE